MATVDPIEGKDWPEELIKMIDPEQMTELEQGLTRYWAHRPDLVKGLAAFSGSLKTNRLLPEKLVELIRLRIAFFNQCRSCMAIRYTDALNDGLTEELVCSLEKPEASEDFTEAEKAAIRYGELMAADHLAIDDDIYDELRKHYSQAEIVELGMTAAFFVGFGRLAATYHMVAELPQAFQAADGEISPWHNDAITVR